MLEIQLGSVMPIESSEAIEQPRGNLAESRFLLSPFQLEAEMYQLIA